jgi:hypothetical protein
VAGMKVPDTQTTPTPSGTSTHNENDSQSKGSVVVYVLIATAVYDQGVYGVFTTEQEAVDHAEALLDESDYHHTFRVDRRTIGVGLPSDQKLGEANDRHKPSSRWALERPTIISSSVELCPRHRQPKPCWCGDDRDWPDA